MPKLRLYNSLTREKEEFKPLDPSHVRVYACGPTVYNYAHIGNARMAVVFDLLANVLKTIYPKVTYVSNITDVDDKIMVAANESGEAIDVITRKFEKIYNEDMSALGVAKPDVQPRATEHIAEMIALIEKLIARGHAYEEQGHVLFNVTSFPAYGGLSGRSRDEQVAGARAEVAPGKKDAADFVLWKPSSAEQPGWDSPWGRGRPGWHIECSAMAEKHLGLPFDIHGGGADLKFPHHENEIAQSCCAHGESDLAAFAKTWVHNGFVTVEGEKMSKSIGNVVLVHDIVMPYRANLNGDESYGWHGEVVRFALLAAHYRQPLDWSNALVGQCYQTFKRMYKILRDLEDIETIDVDVTETDVFEILCDDLNTPKAFAVLSKKISDLSKTDDTKQKIKLKSELISIAKLLGILQYTKNEWDNTFHYELGADDQKLIDTLIQERQEARAAKNFVRADEIRDQLAAEGIVIEDTGDGPKARKIS